jgi:hypothetical protein
MLRSSRAVWVAIGVAVLLASVAVRHSASSAPKPIRYVDGAVYRLSAGAARSARTEVLPPSRPLRFDSSVTPEQRGLVLQAIADARPEARRLVRLVSGLTTIHAGAVRGGDVGLTQPQLDGTFVLALDVDLAYRIKGQRGVDRLVLHELGHVLDVALVRRDLERTLDAATPAGIGCDEGHNGACAPVRERFAESFAKWATRDMGLDVYEGYKVPPPDLETWGQPLAALRR